MRFAHRERLYLDPVDGCKGQIGDGDGGGRGGACATRACLVSSATDSKCVLDSKQSSCRHHVVTASAEGGGAFASVIFFRSSCTTSAFNVLADMYGGEGKRYNEPERCAIGSHVP